MAENKKLIVISAINFTEGGPLSILKDSLTYASKHLADQYDVIALVHSKTLFDIPNVKIMEYPNSKKSWVSRLYYEWFYFHKLSLQLKPFLWLSLHDITPRVKADKQAVYCHNPSPFYEIKPSEMIIDFKFALFNLFYSFLYKININKNDWVIVQQSWIRKEFTERYPIKRVVVAHPDIPKRNSHPSCQKKNYINKIIFFFPAYPRVFKNIELLCKSATLLRDDYELWITINGKENQYAKKIVKNYSKNKNIKFIGLQTREKVFDIYKVADCLIFPSKLETWGMPISEFKTYKKPILVADLPYAHETIGEYEYAKYFDPNDVEQLANYMKLLIHGQLEYDAQEFIEPSQPFASNWQQLFDILLKNHPKIA